MRITKTLEFCASHRLPKDSGKCRSLHGHNYVLEVVLFGESDPETLMLSNFRDVKSVVKKHIIDFLDHSTILWDGDDLKRHILNFMREDESFAEVQRLVVLNGEPTAENIASHIHWVLSKVLPKFEYCVLFETDTCSAITDHHDSSRIEYLSTYQEDGWNPFEWGNTVGVLTCPANLLQGEAFRPNC